MLAVQCRPSTLDDLGQDRAEIKDLVERHKAVTDWSTLLPERAQERKNGRAFSIEIDEAISAYRDTAILFIAYLFDVRRTDSGITASFQIAGVDHIFFVPDIYPYMLQLRCDTTIANYLLGNSIESNGAFALIAKQTGFNFPGWDLEAWYEPGSDYRWYQSDFFMLRGELLEAKFLGD